MTNYRLQFLDVENQSKTFGEWLRENRKAKYLTMEALADKVGVSKQYISVLERAEPHALTDKPVTPTVEKVEAIAKALEADIDEARHAAGYAPKTDTENAGLMRDLDNLSPERKVIAKKQIRAIIDTLKENKDKNDFDYI